MSVCEDESVLMRYGKLSQAVWNRTVGRQFGKKKIADTVFPLRPEGNCAGIHSADAEFIWSGAAVSGNSECIGAFGVLHAVGKLAAEGVRTEGITVQVLFPPETEEEHLKGITESIEKVCVRMGITLMGFQGEVSPAALLTTVFVNAAGKRISGCIFPARGNDPDSAEIILCGFVGLEGMLRILKEGDSGLNDRFVSSFLAGAQSLEKELVMPEIILDIMRPETGTVAVRQIGSGGLLGTLWEAAEILDTGLEVDLNAAALKQETVEICEYFRINPYQLTSAGSYLIVTTEAQNVLKVLEKAGARAGRLGVTKAQKARVITSGQEIRYLDRPAPDEMTVWLTDRCRNTDTYNNNRR